MPPARQMISQLTRQNVFRREMLTQLWELNCSLMFLCAFERNLKIPNISKQTCYTLKGYSLLLSKVAVILVKGRFRCVQKEIARVFSLFLLFVYFSLSLFSSSKRRSNFTFSLFICFPLHQSYFRALGLHKLCKTIYPIDLSAHGRV